MNDMLSARRLGHLLRGDFITGYRSLLTVSGALAGVILVAAMIAPSSHPFGADFHDGPRFHRALFTAVLFIWGIIASSRALRPLHDKTRNEAWLLLPASALEKTLAALLAVTVGLVAWLLVFSTVVSVVVESLNLLFVGKRHAFFNPFDPVVWERISIYLVLQSLYFLGGAWFRRAHFIKTTFAIAVALIGLAALAAITARIAFADLPVHVSLHVRNLVYVLVAEPYPYTGVATAALYAVMVLLPLTCWCIAWMRVAETQVSDGV